ncbi:cucumber peeling cupredoxin-like [Benincasa hispida]|uniref:cucumber peeling cupredoxin-like n=1 Tax=Benincasa hispida TaxID=102211 RepID=UPI00190104D3|nr:cucumber peeling cupredoxin-like [Benincasa hispida]
MAGGVGFVLGLIAVVFVHHATATVHVVGDATGWTIPSSTTFYSDWADKNTFAVGDSLSFKFMTGSHDVLKVSKESFEACNIDDGIGNTLTTGPATVKLDTAGVHYFICTVGKHCSGGQKLAVTVSGSATPGGAVAPSPNTTDKPLVTPTPASSPSSSSVENEGGSPAAPAPSSSTAVMATFYVTLSAIVMNMLF